MPPASTPAGINERGALAVIAAVGDTWHGTTVAADDPVTPELDRIRRREAHGDGIGVHIKINEQDASVGGRRASEDNGGGHGLGFAPGRADGFFLTRQFSVGAVCMSSWWLFS